MGKLIRLIPSLLIDNNYLVKGEKFKNHNYVGDIFNAVKIYSEKNVHEIQILDISIRKKNKSIDLNLIKKIRSEIFVPLAVGGGIKSFEEASLLINEGVEKIILNSSIFNNYNLINQLAKKFGSQSIVISCDIKKINNEYKLFSNSGIKLEKVNFYDHLKKIQDYGAGEVMVTSIDYEGTKRGLDLDLFNEISSKINIQLIASGGVGKFDDIIEYFENCSGSAIACGTFFVFYGRRKAVLINYPDKEKIAYLMNKYE
tara:strand:- start:1580 stop:2350 length:771 start_codon:yes stop_codon:yes gene_type:complete